MKNNGVTENEWESLVQTVSNDSVNLLWENNDKQLIYLDFDGEQTWYRNQDLNLNFSVDVADSGIEEKRRSRIAELLNEKYQEENLYFTTEKPVGTSEYSTIFIGKTDDFDAHGAFAGMAETIDEENQIKDDNAYVLADKNAGDQQIISVIDHELSHIVGGEEHEKKTGTLQDYACELHDGYCGTVTSIYDYDYVPGHLPDNDYRFRVAKSGYYRLSLDTDSKYLSARIEFPDYKPMPAVPPDTVSDLMNFLNFTNVQFGVNKPVTVYLDKNYPAQYRIVVTNSLPIYADSYLDMKKSQWYTVRMTPYKLDDGGSNNSTNVNQPPNLAIRNLSMVSSTTTAKSVKIKFNVINAGSGGAKQGSYVHINDGFVNLGSVYVGPISAGGSKAKTFTIAKGRLSAGIHTIQLVADATNVLKESNENNTVSKKLKVIQAQPNLAIRNLSMVSSTTTAKSVKIKFNVINAGNLGASTGTYVYINDGFRNLGSVYVGPISAGGSKAKSFTIAKGQLSVGTHTIQLVADATNALIESNENNTVSKKLKVIRALPNLAIRNLSMVSSTTTARSVKIKFNVLNAGNLGASRGTYVYVYDGSKKLGSVYVGPISAGSSKAKSFTIAKGKLKVGTHTIKLVADATKVLEEINESNTVSKKLKVSRPLPNLAIQKVSLASTALSSQAVTIKFSVKNAGDAGASRGTYVYVYDGTKKLGSVYVGPISAGGSKAKSFTIAKGKLKVGTHTIKLVADATKVLKESNENNTVSKKLIVGDNWGTDLQISLSSSNSTSMTQTPSGVTGGLFSFTIRNVGTESAESTFVDLYDGTRWLDYIWISPLSAGESRKYEFSLGSYSLAAGSHTLKVEVDEYNWVAEFNENNNIATHSLQVISTGTGAKLSLKTASAAPATTGTTTDWEVVAYEDLNQDGFEDLLLSDGSDLTDWQNPSADQISALTSQLPGSDWEFVGLGDYNGDTRNELLLKGSANTLEPETDENKKLITGIA